MNILVLATLFLPLVMSQPATPQRVATCQDGDPVCEIEPVSFSICPIYCAIRPDVPASPNLFSVWSKSVMQYLAFSEYIQVYLSDGSSVIYRQADQSMILGFSDFTDIFFAYPYPIGGEGAYWIIHYTRIASFKP